MTRRSLFIIVSFISTGAAAQSLRDVEPQKRVYTAERYASQVISKAELFERRLGGKMEKTLAQLSRWEYKVQKLLKEVNPEIEQRLFDETKTFKCLLTQIKSGEGIVKRYHTQYNAYLDTVISSLKYFRSGTEATPIVNAIEKVEILNARIKQSEYVASFITMRKRELLAELKDVISRKLLMSFGKEEYYYLESLRNYEELFNIKTRIEHVTVQTLNNIPGFRDFMRKNSMLSGLFRVPASDLTATSPSGLLPGIQSRLEVQSHIHRRIASGGPNGTSQMRQNLSEAESKFAKVTDELIRSTNIAERRSTDVPAFAPNSQKSKTLGQRLEYGLNIQFSNRNLYQAATSDLAIILGYKLNDKSVLGVGVSYKFGLGNVRDIRPANEGTGVRSFLDWKIKKQWYASGGYELNYSAGIDIFGDVKSARWRQTGIIGVARQYEVGKNLTAEVKMLLDFPVYEQSLQKPRIQFCTGYKLK